jgi:hypothetical protein
MDNFLKAANNGCTCNIAKQCNLFIQYFPFVLLIVAS